MFRFKENVRRGALLLVVLSCSWGCESSTSSVVEETESLLEIRVGWQDIKPLLSGTPKQLVATGIYDDGREEDISSEVEWSTSNEAIATFELDPRPGWISVPGNGPISIIATLGEVTGSLETCTYPGDFSPYLRPLRRDQECPCSLGPPIPYVYWNNAYHPGGEVGPLRFADLHCDASISIMIFVVGTTWCGACSSYASRIAGEASEIEAAGGRIVFIELQNNERELATSAETQQHLSGYIGQDVGYRVGDAETLPGNGGYFSNSGVVTGYPTVVIVRRNDMRIIADSSTGARDLDLVAVAQNPDRDWTAPPPPEVVDNCGGQDEETEPANNEPATAPILNVGEQAGGICDAEPDYYKIEMAGPWRLELEFEHSVGDLDVAVWNTDTDEPVRGGDGELLGSYTDDDNEGFEHAGPALIKIFGFHSASAPYALTLESR